MALPTLGSTVAELEIREWPPFVAAFQAGVAAVMTAHIVLSSIDPEFPATLSRPVITGLLRERLGFQGAVFSDALEMKAIAARWGGSEAAVLALAAGVDMPVQVGSLEVHEATVAAVERATAEGRLDLGALAASAVRLGRLERRHGTIPSPALAWREADSELLDQAARRALVGIGRVPRLDSGSSVGWLLAAQAHHHNPYDGHTLATTMAQLAKLSGREPDHAFVDMCYRGHGYEGTCTVHVDKRRRGRIPQSTWKWMKRRSAIEPTISHLKSSRRLDKNRLKGALGDQMNAIMSAAGMNLHKILKDLAGMPATLALFLRWLLELLRRHPADAKIASAS